MLNKNHLHRIAEFVVGLLFGLGLMLSGMTDPGKVIGFLDLFGTWDPSLALVMGGAIMVGFFAFTVAKKRTATFLGGAMRLPTNIDMDKKRLGLGWVLPWPGSGVDGGWPTQGAGVCSGHAGRHAGL